MQKSDLIIETSSNTFNCLYTDDQSISFHFKGLKNESDSQSFTMSKTALYKIFQGVIDSPINEKQVGNFTPNIG